MGEEGAWNFTRTTDLREVVLFSTIFSTLLSPIVYWQTLNQYKDADMFPIPDSFHTSLSKVSILRPLANTNDKDIPETGLKEEIYCRKQMFRNVFKTEVND